MERNTTILVVVGAVDVGPEAVMVEALSLAMRGHLPLKILGSSLPWVANDELFSCLAPAFYLQTTTNLVEQGYNWNNVICTQKAERVLFLKVYIYVSLL